MLTCKKFSRDEFGGKMDLETLVAEFQEFRSLLKSPLNYFKQKIMGFFKSEISKIFTAILSAQAPAQSKAEKGAAESAATKPQSPRPSSASPRAPVMSAYETVPAGRSFWDSPANDVRAWAEDVIRNQDAGDAHSLGSLANRL